MSKERHRGHNRYYVKSRKGGYTKVSISWVESTGVDASQKKMDLGKQEARLALLSVAENHHGSLPLAKAVGAY